MKENILIISNNVLSRINNNGKTILSYFDSIDSSLIYQLYFSQEEPTISHFKYFRISDKDILHGLFTKKRGCEVFCRQEVKGVPEYNSSYHGSLARIARELLWLHKWKSKELIQWLDRIKPKYIFFVGGDCLFAYTIALFIKERYASKLSLYITDDYFVRNKFDNIITVYKKHLLRNKCKKFINFVDSFFTISDPMRLKYKELFGKDSYTIANIPDDLENNEINLRNEISIRNFVYAGSLYYGRDKVLNCIIDCVEKINSLNKTFITVDVYSDECESKIIKKKCVNLHRKVNNEELKEVFRKSDAFIFVESFEEKYVSKTMFSLSTKIPEYLSFRKPIFAVGPNNVGSMMYLQNIAICANSLEEVYDKVCCLLFNPNEAKEFADKSYRQYLKNHKKSEVQQKFLSYFYGKNCKKKVLQVNSVCGVGSTGKICVGIKKESEEQDIENTIIFTNGNNSDLGIKISSFTRQKIYALLSRITGRYGFVSKKNSKELIRYIIKYNPDLVHLHNIHDHVIDFKTLFYFLKRTNIKIVYTFHDCWAFTGYCPHFIMAKCDKWKTTCHHCPLRKEFSWFFDKSKMNFESKKKVLSDLDLTIVTPSKWLADLVKQSFLKDYPVKVINNGIDLNVFKSRRSSFKQKYALEGKFVILGVAFGWTYRKGLDVFIELSKRLPSNYKIVLVGTNDSIDKQLPKSIISIHRTHNQIELAELYSTADVFVNPTREDTFPTVNIESLACGTPVLTFRTGGSPEILDDTCGSVVDCDDVDGLEKEIIRVCETRPYSKEACLQHADYFDEKRMFYRYIQMYNELLFSD